jgi:hypothetical protein
VVVGPRGELRADNPAAQDWQERFDQIAPGRFTVVMQLMAGDARTAPHAASAPDCGTRTADGQSCRPAPLIGGDDDQVAVAIEPASGDQLLGLLPVAYGLISRERDLCREVISGRSTSEIPGSDVPFE